MRKLRVCAVITGRGVEAAQRADADLFEVRIDMIGPGWRDAASGLRKPWIACNRSAANGGKWSRGEKGRIDELLSAIDLGADIIDIELDAPGLRNIVKQIKGRAACLISHHDWQGTPSTAQLATVVRRELRAGADICKIVTTARGIDDNIAPLQVIGMFPTATIVAFAMGEAGMLSRILAPLAGSYFTYASTGRGKESAPGQIPAATMRRLLGTVQ